MLRWRVLVAVLILVPLAGILAADFWWSGKLPGIFLLPLSLLISLAAAGEALDMLQSQNVRPARWSTFMGTALVVGASFAPLAWAALDVPYPASCPLGRVGWLGAALAVSVTLAFGSEMVRYRGPGGVIVNLSSGVFVVAYVGLMMGFLTLLRTYHSNEYGFGALVSVILIVKASDMGAYFAGRVFGRTRMAPLLSPKKTWEGGVGGYAAAWLTSWWFFHVLEPAFTGASLSTPATWRWLAYGTIVCSFGILGDLAESLFKRDMGSKDSSHWIPGLGGVLDILDSVLLAAPAAYACWMVGLVGPGS